MKKIIPVLAVCLAFSCSRNSEDPCTEFDAVDLQMLELIEQIESNHRSNKRLLSNFTMEQVYWTQYRDHHLKSIYPEDWNRHYRAKYGKEVFNPCKCKEMTRFTKARIEELKLWIQKGPTGQSECPAIWNE